MGLGGGGVIQHARKPNHMVNQSSAHYSQELQVCLQTYNILICSRYVQKL